MYEERIESIIREFVEAVVEKDVERVLSFLTEDAVWAAPEGTFKGKEKIKRYLTWMTQNVPDLTLRDAGIGIVVKGNKAVYEHVTAGTIEDMRYESPSICVYELSDEKIRYHRAVYDRLSIGRQMTKGWFAKRMVNSFVKRAEKGLR